MDEEYKRKTIAAYDAPHEKFVEQYLKTLPFRLPDIQRFLGMLHGKKILDLGSGPGIDAAHMQEAGFEVLCVDLSEKMIEACKELGLSAKRMDIEILELPAASFDGVYAAGSIVHVPKEKFEKVVLSVARALKDDGVLFISLKQDEGDRKISYAGERTFFYWQPEEATAILKKHFSIEHEEVQHVSRQATWIKIFCRKTHKGKKH